MTIDPFFQLLEKILSFLCTHDLFAEVRLSQHHLFQSCGCLKSLTRKRPEPHEIILCSSQVQIPCSKKISKFFRFVFQELFEANQRWVHSFDACGVMHYLERSWLFNSCWCKLDKKVLEKFKVIISSKPHSFMGFEGSSVEGGKNIWVPVK